MIGEPAEWAFWAVISLLTFLMVLPGLKRSLRSEPQHRPHWRRQAPLGPVLRP
jgi:hypothetical protein